MDKTLDERLFEFWQSFNKLEKGESCIEQDGEKCVDLAASIIPELEEEINTLREALKGLSVSLGVEHAKHSPPVMLALIRARTVLNIMVQNHS